MLKATKVDGVYDADPVRDPQAQRYERIGYDEVLRDNLAVMDQTAIVMLRDHRLPLMVYDMTRRGDLLRILQGDDSVATRVDAETEQ